MTYNFENDYQMVKAIEKHFIQCCDELIGINKTNKATINAIKKSQDKFYYVKRLIVKAYLQKQISYRKLLYSDYKKRKINNNKNIKNHKSTFYHFLNLLKELWRLWENQKWYPTPETFQKMICRPTIPIKPNCKYNHDQRKQIADHYFEQSIYSLNKTNIWFDFRQNDERFKNIALSTVCHFIKNDPRSLKSKEHHKCKHNLRCWDIDIGNIQLDFKDIGRNKFNKNIYILDAKDQQSKFYWAKLVEKQDQYQTVNGLCEMIAFFNSYGIKIKTIRTDNAFVFKTKEFENILKFNNIEHEFIPIRQPQCNGVIERQHRILDNEMINHINEFNTIDDFRNALHLYNQYYNHKRIHYYTFMKMKNLESYDTPINFINKYLPLQNKTIILQKRVIN